MGRRRKALYAAIGKMPSRRLRVHALRIIWRRGVQSEVAFWDRWLATKGLEWPADFQRRVDPLAPLTDSFVIEAIQGMPHQVVEILDVGAGPLTVLEKKLSGRELRITAVDPLAGQYAALLERYDVRPIVRTQSCDAESLRRMFSKGTFDLTYARNALDHSFNPIKAITQMLHVTKDGGFVLLKHIRNEATRRQYVDFHQWNFDRRANDFVVWNPLLEWNVTRELRGLATVSVETPDDWILCKIQKKSQRA